MCIRLEDTEREKTRGLRLSTRIAYTYCFRWHMDFKSCITGMPPRLINWMDVWQEVEEFLERGSNNKRKSLTEKQKKDKVRSIVRELERNKIMLPVHKNGKKLPMVFLLPLAYKISPSKGGTTHPLKQQLPLKSSTYTVQKPSFLPRNNTYLVNNININNNNNILLKEVKWSLREQHTLLKNNYEYSYTYKPPHAEEQHTPSRKDRKDGSSEVVNRIFEHWKTSHNHPDAKLSPKRIKIIKRAIKLDYDEKRLAEAISGCLKVKWNMGENPQGAIYDDIELILRDCAHIDRFIRANNKPTRKNGHEENKRFETAHQRVTRRLGKQIREFEKENGPMWPPREACNG